MTTPHPKRLIEVDLPIKRISAHARREKSIRHGHISTLHIWWARRPLAACRAVILGALWPDPADPNCPQRFRKEARERMLRWARDNAAKASTESFDCLVRIQKNERVLDDPVEVRKCLLDFIADFANWDNSNDPAYLETSRALVQVAHEVLGGVPGTRPLVVDPFAGGGSIPLEALRVGADAFASDLNPVAVLLNKVVLQYIPKYGQRLADEVRKWGAWVKKKAEIELAEFYPKDPDGSTPVAYLWARTIKCEGPGCGVEVPLIRSLWLARRPGRSVVLQLVPQPARRGLDVRILTEDGDGWLGQTGGRIRLDSAKLSGTTSGAAASCPCCGFTTPKARVRAQIVAQAGGADSARLLAVVTVKPGRSGREYRVSCESDLAPIRAAHTEGERYAESDSLDGLPAEPIPYERVWKNNPIRVHLYGMTRWKQLFTSRQAVALLALARLTRQLGSVRPGADDTALAEAVATSLALAVGRQSDYTSSLCIWVPSGEFVCHTFGRQAIPMVWDFVEVAPFADASGSFSGAVEWVAGVLQREGMSRGAVAHVEQASATAHPLPDDSASALITDPPYYDAVPYSTLSNYFYVWLRRSLPASHGALAKETLTPNVEECVVDDARGKTHAVYEGAMELALAEARRVLSVTGIGVVVFAHKSTSGWEALLGAMCKAGWVVSASWPIDTERPGRLRANDSAALASSVHLVCRPRENPNGSVRTDAIGDWRDVLAELPKRIHEWMPRLAEEGVVGADAIFACLGPALEIFSRYSHVEKASGEQVTLKEYLEHVWAAVAKEALSMIFAGAETSGFEEDARLTAMWLWTLSTAGGNGKVDSTGGEEDESEEDEDDGKVGKKAKFGGFALEYDAARKIAQGLGAHLEGLTTLVEVKGETARLLPVAERTRALFGKSEAAAPTARRKKKAQQMKLGFAEELEEAEETGGWGHKGAPRAGQTVLDRVHQSMILFAAGRGEALRRFLVDEGTGRDARFWRLAQALAALYPTGTDERRWVEGVLARKKGLGF